MYLCMARKKISLIQIFPSGLFIVYHIKPESSVFKEKCFVLLLLLVYLLLKNKIQKKKKKKRKQSKKQKNNNKKTTKMKNILLMF